MNGLVSWLSDDHKQYRGVVRRCVREGDTLNLAFTCDKFGQSQLTLAITADWQATTCRYSEDDWETTSFPEIDGSLWWDGDSAVFSGTWLDQNDGTGAWRFEIDLRQFDVAASAKTVTAPLPAIGDGAATIDRIVQYLDRSYLTDWFAGDIDPIHPGVYRMLMSAPDRAPAVHAYALWDGAAWFSPKNSIDALKAVHEGWRLLDDDAQRPWCGLTEDGHRHLLAQLTADDRRKIEQKNRDLLDTVRHYQRNLDAARDDAQHKYRLVLAARGNLQALSSAERILIAALDLDDLKRDFADSADDADDADDPDLTGKPEQIHQQLEAIHARCTARIVHWNSYWHERMGDALASPENAGSKRTVVDWEKIQQVADAKNAFLRPLAGSFEGKKRK
jgi:hypothetical protein